MVRTENHDLRLAEAHLLRAHASYEQRGYDAYRPLALYELAQISARLAKPDRALDFLAKALDAGYEPEGSAPGGQRRPAARFSPDPPSLWSAAFDSASDRDEAAVTTRLEGRAGVRGLASRRLRERGVRSRARKP